MIPQYFGKSDMVESLFLKLWTMLNWQRKCESLYLITVISSHCSSHHLEKCAFTPLAILNCEKKNTHKTCSIYIIWYQFENDVIAKMSSLQYLVSTWKLCGLQKCPVYSIWSHKSKIIHHNEVQFTVFGVNL